MLNDAELNAALGNAAGDPPSGINPGRAFARARAIRHRRRMAGCALALAAVAALGTAAATTGALTKSSTATLQPVVPSRPVLADINGVDVTLLPAGMRLTGPPSYGQTQSGLTSYGWTTEARNPGNRNQTLTIVVVRDTPAAIADQMRPYDPKTTKKFEVTGGTLTSVTVRGHTGGLIANLPSSQGPPTNRITWAENPGLIISVDGHGLTLKQVQDVADGLVVHAAPAPPAHDPNAVTAIRAALNQAYDGSNPAAVKLAAVQNGTTLIPTLQRLGELLPHAVTSSKISVGRITFLSAGRAVVDTNLTFDYDRNPANAPVQTGGLQTVVLDHGRWLVLRSSYCSFISAPGGANCPTS